MWKKVRSLRSLPGFVVVALAAAALATVAGPLDSQSQPQAQAGAAHVFVPTAVSIPESDTVQVPTF